MDLINPPDPCHPCAIFAGMIRSRIAPTPSGYLHIGNAMNFVLTSLIVHKQAGKLCLRIDDIDAPRAKPEYIDDIFQTLDWMGLHYDEGPRNADEHIRRYSQALRADRYSEMIQQLIRTGKVFACDCSRKDLSGHPCTCKEKNLPLDQPDTALRIITPGKPVEIHDKKAGILHIDLDKEMKDFVIRRRDGIAAYQVASLADDIDHSIDLIVRGADLLGSTAAQLYLASLIKADDFMQTTFYHHPLLNDSDGQKLSKSSGSLSLKAIRVLDNTPEKLYIELSKLLGIKKSCASLREMQDTDLAF